MGSIPSTKGNRGWDIECLPSIHKALYLIPSTTEERGRRRRVGEERQRERERLD
jgi:hypothetical protein